jgi:hypothetical protein
MSAGAFSISKYELDGGQIAAVRVQPETLAATFAGDANVAPAGAVNLPGRFPLNTGGRNKKPFAARYVTVRFTATVPTGYAANSTPRIPILTQALFNAIVRDTTVGVYLGAAVLVTGKVSERN